MVRIDGEDISFRALKLFLVFNEKDPTNI